MPKHIRYDPANDLYAVLGVQPLAAENDIRRVFRQRAKEVHPDRNPDKREWAHQQFQRLNEAYEVLADATHRGEYDRLRQRYHQGRGVDGLAWWERPNPPTPGYAAAAGSAGGSNGATRRPTAENGAHTARSATYHRYERMVWAKHHRKSYRPYQLLFLISSLMLCVSVGSWASRMGFLQLSSESATATAIALAPPVTCPDPNAMITAPQNGEEVSGQFAIHGTATGEHFVSYRIEIRPVTAPTPDHLDLMLIAAQLEKAQPVENGLLAEVLSTQMKPGDYSLRLIVQLDDQTTLQPCTALIHYKPSAS